MRQGMATIGAVLALALMAGCADAPADMSDPVPVAGSGPVPATMCGADGYQALVGRPEAVVQAISLPSPARIMQIGSPYAQDYNPKRINILFDKQRIITKVYCG